MPAQSPSNEAAAGAETAPLQGCVELSIGLGLCGLIVLAREPQARGVLEVQQAMDQGDQFEAQLVAPSALAAAHSGSSWLTKMMQVSGTACFTRATVTRPDSWPGSP